MKLEFCKDIGFETANISCLYCVNISKMQTPRYCRHIFILAQYYSFRYVSSTNIVTILKLTELYFYL